MFVNCHYKYSCINYNIQVLSEIKPTYTNMFENKQPFLGPQWKTGIVSNCIQDQLLNETC